MSSTAAAAAEFTVQHQPAQKRFAAVFSDGALGLLEYEQVAPGRYDFHHTEVPESKSGRGVGAALASVRRSSWTDRREWMKGPC